MNLDQALYGACSASFVALIVLILLRGRVNGRGMMIVAASGLTGLWAANLSMGGLVPQAAATFFDNLVEVRPLPGKEKAVGSISEDDS